MPTYRARKPQPEKDYKFSVPEIQRYRLGNGLEISLVERHNLPLVRVNLMAGCGSSLDPLNKKGLANLFSMSIDEGAGEYNALELSSEFDLLGSDFNIHSTNDSLYFLSRTLKENTEKTLYLMSAVVLNPLFNEEDFQKQKSKVLTRLTQTKDDPDEISANAFEYLIFNRKHPYAFPVLGLENDIRSVSVDDIKKFYAEHLVPRNSHLIFSGDITMDEVINLSSKYFSNWHNRPAQKITPPAAEENHPGIYFIDKPGSMQSEIKTGHLTARRDKQNYFPRLLLNMALGGQFSSRINLNLREDKGYTYGAFSGFSFFKHSGYFYVSTSVGIENTFNSLSELRKELVEIRNGITSEELNFAKISLIRKFPSNFETNGQIASSISRMILYDLPDDHFNKYIQHIQEVSGEQVNKAAEEYIFPDRMITLIVGNKKDILSQFEGKELLTELDIYGNPLN